MVKLAPMGDTDGHSWRSVYHEMQRRISEQIWRAGDTIPTEAELAKELGCARTTVNRALRQLAETGVLDRRRKAGTKVVINPVRKATLSIPIIRRQIEDQGLSYGYELLSRVEDTPPRSVSPDKNRNFIRVRARYFGGNKAYVYEDRWIDTDTVPHISNADLSVVGANEWLLNNAPFTNGEMKFQAEAASEPEAAALNIAPGAPVLVTTRRTWVHGDLVTVVRLVYAPGYHMKTTL